MSATGQKRHSSRATLIDEAGLDRQRDAAGGDEGDAPEDQPAIDVHVSVLSCSVEVHDSPVR